MRRWGRQLILKLLDNSRVCSSAPPPGPFTFNRNAFGTCNHGSPHRSLHELLTLNPGFPPGSEGTPRAESPVRVSREGEKSGLGQSISQSIGSLR